MRGGERAEVGVARAAVRWRGRDAPTAACEYRTSQNLENVFLDFCNRV